MCLYIYTLLGEDAGGTQGMDKVLLNTKHLNLDWLFIPPWERWNILSYYMSECFVESVQFAPMIGWGELVLESGDDFDFSNSDAVSR